MRVLAEGAGMQLQAHASPLPGFRLQPIELGLAVAAAAHEFIGDQVIDIDMPAHDSISRTRQQANARGTPASCSTLARQPSMLICRNTCSTKRSQTKSGRSCRTNGQAFAQGISVAGIADLDRVHAADSLHPDYQL